VKCLKWYARSPAAAKTFRVNLLGLHEVMRPCLVDRPQGTGDYLLMFFHHEAWVKDQKGILLRPPGSLIIWTPRDGHFYGNENRRWDHSWIHCSGPAIPGILRRAGLPIGEPFVVSDPLVLENYLLETAAELSGWEQPHEIILRNLFENFIQRLLRQTMRQARPLVPAPLLAVRAHIEEHFAEKLRLPALARRAGWSPSHLCTEFKRHFGVPLIQYAMQLRMNHAVYLLRDQNRRVGEIGERVGYPDLYTFSKMFKRHSGVGPRAFRRLNCG
jgi:AraC-like DNA-binding protein